MEKKQSQHKQNFIVGLWKNNPLFVMLLGTCPSLGVTTSLEAALGMGVLFTIVLVCSNVIISLVKKLIPEEIRTPSYILIIATFVTIVKMFANAFLPELYSTLGVFISLIVVNCIVLGRAEAFASKNGVWDSFLDGLGNGLGYTLALSMIGLIREVLGTGMITWGDTLTFLPSAHWFILVNAAIDPTFDMSMSFFTTPAGAFVVFGCILGVISTIRLNKAAKAKALAAKKAAEAKAAAAAAAASATPAAPVDGGSK